jgi:hypothetical protein
VKVGVAASEQGRKRHWHVAGCSLAINRLIACLS